MAPVQGAGAPSLLLASSDKAIELIRAEHTYDVPEIIVMPVSGGLSDYIDWVNEETAQ